jgi:hypothetical protein
MAGFDSDAESHLQYEFKRSAGSPGKINWMK